MMLWLGRGGRKAGGREPTGNGRGVAKPQACPQWHTSFIKTWSPIPFQTSSPTGDQVLKHRNLLGPFSFKLLQLHTGVVADLG